VGLVVSKFLVSGKEKAGVDSPRQGTSFYAAYDNRIGIICQGILNMRLKRGLMADVRGVWLPKSQKADISFLSSCGIKRRIHHPTANSRLDDPESPVNTSRLIVTDRLDMDHFRFADKPTGRYVDERGLSPSGGIRDLLRIGLS